MNANESIPLCGVCFQPAGAPSGLCPACQLEADDREDFARELEAEYAAALERQRDAASLARWGGRAVRNWYVSPVTAWQAALHAARVDGRPDPSGQLLHPARIVGWAFTSSAAYVASQARSYRQNSPLAALQDARAEAAWLDDLDRYSLPAWPILEAGRAFLGIEPGNVWYADQVRADLEPGTPGAARFLDQL